MNIEERLKEGYYTNFGEVVPRPKKPVLTSRATPKQAREYADALEKYSQDLASFLAYCKERDKQVSILYEQFKVDLKEDLGITDHPKAETLFDLAWEYGHSGGYREVYNYALDLVDLLV